MYIPFVLGGGVLIWISYKLHCPEFASLWGYEIELAKRRMCVILWRQKWSNHYSLKVCIVMKIMVTDRSKQKIPVCPHSSLCPSLLEHWSCSPTDHRPSIFSWLWTQTGDSYPEAAADYRDISWTFPFFHFKIAWLATPSLILQLPLLGHYFPSLSHNYVRLNSYNKSLFPVRVLWLICHSTIDGYLGCF